MEQSVWDCEVALWAKRGWEAEAWDGKGSQSWEEKKKEVCMMKERRDKVCWSRIVGLIEAGDQKGETSYSRPYVLGKLELSLFTNI